MTSSKANSPRLPYFRCLGSLGGLLKRARPPRTRMARALGLCVAELGVFSLLAGSVTLAQLVPDNTLGEESSVIAPGLVDGLPADLVEGGAARGANLFHSFESFNIDAGQRLYFANPAGITDILSRVTGGSVSNINGLLGVDGPANLFLLNPNGILFGSEAELDLRGSFLASTGDSFIFGNGELFSATEPGTTPLLSVSVPLGVQYSSSPGSITASGSILAAPSNETLALIGGNIDLDSVQITAPSGQIEIGAVADTTISIDNSSNGLSVDTPTDFSGRDIRIIDSGITTYPEDFGDTGNLEIIGGTAIIRGSYLETSTEDGNAGDLLIGVTGSLVINFSELYSGDFLFGTGAGGDLRISAGSALIRDSYLESSVGQGEAGNIFISVDDSLIIDLSEIYSDVIIGEGGDIQIDAGSAEIIDAIIESSTLEGNAGNLNIIIDNSFLVNESYISSDVYFGSGNGGQIQINSGSAQFRNSSIFTGAVQGDAGNLNITADDTLELNATRLYSNASFGSGGDISLLGNLVSILNGSRISTSVDGGQGDSGSINIAAFDVARINDSLISSDIPEGVAGNGGNIRIEAGSFYTERSNLIASLSGQGRAGNITIQTDGVARFLNTNLFSNITENAIGNGGDIEIFSQSLIFEGLTGDNNTQGFVTTADGLGNAGNIRIFVEEAVELNRLSNGSVAFFSSIGSTGKGRSGNIEITADSLSLTTSALINGSFGQGDIGDIILDIDNLASFSGGGIYNNLVGDGNGGRIIIEAGDLIVQNGAQLFTSTEGNGSAGSVLVNADNSVIVDGIGELEVRSSSIFSSSEGGATGSAGSITINSPHVLISNSGVINARTETSSRGGSLTINAEVLELIDGGQTITSTTGTGQAGNIQLNIDEIIIEGFNQDYGQFINNPLRLRVDTQGPESGLFATTNSSGTAGNITLQPHGNGQTLSVTLAEDAQITASTAENSTGQGGSVRLSAPQQITLAGDGQISVETSGAGIAGNVLIQAPTLTLQDGVQISSTANATATPTSSGGGQFTVNVSSLNLLGTGGLFAETEGATAAGSFFLSPYGNGSNLTISFQNGTQISTNTSGSGVGGNINLSAPERITIQGSSRLSSETSGAGTAGNLNVTTGDLTIQNGATLSVSSSAVLTSTPALAADTTAGPAGNININARSVRLTDQASLQASTTSGEGGNINLQVADTLVMRRNSSISTEAGGSGNGGKITATAGFIVTAPEENNDIIANAVAGSGGRVSLTANRILGFTPRSGLTTAELRSNTSSDLSASSELGTEGDVEVANLAVDPSQGLSELPVTFSDTSNQIAQGCRARGTETQSEFVVTGRGGLPTSPADPPTADIEPIPWATQNLSPAEGDATSHGVTPAMTATVAEVPEIVEAQGWVRDANGDVVFVAAPTVASPQPSELVTAGLCPGQAPQNQE